MEEAIFSRAAKDAEDLWAEFGRPIKISINVSGESIQNREFEHFLLELAGNYHAGVPLCIEITEQTAVDFNEELKERIGRLRAAGYIFAIDDFSAGNTSLQYFRENCFDIVKLDGSIVQNCITNPRSHEITASIIELSHSLGFKVLAEYVSSEEIRDAMATAGCTMYQGWLYSPAVTLEKFKKLLEKSLTPAT